MPFQSGQQIGGWTIERVLGEGGMGIVLLVRCGDLRRALKLLKSRDEEHLLRFEREAQVMATIGDVPGVVRIHEVLRTPVGPAIVMDYVDGESLQDRLRRGSLDFEEASELIASLADALTVVHGRGIRHRDLKPANILLPRDGGLPLVSDFGVAHLTDEQLTQTGQAVGTLAWMAPEQLAGASRDVGPGCDVWALGVILHQCLTGQLPWENATGPALSSRILKARLSLSGELSFPARSLIERCLQLDPDDRPNAAELAELLRDPPQPGARSMAGRVGKVALKVFALLVFLGLFGVVLRVRRREAKHRETLQRQTTRCRTLLTEARRLVADQLVRTLVAEGLGETSLFPLPDLSPRIRTLEQQSAALSTEGLVDESLAPILERVQAISRGLSELAPAPAKDPVERARARAAVVQVMLPRPKPRGKAITAALEVDAALARDEDDLESLATRLVVKNLLGEVPDTVERALHARLTAEIAVRRLAPVVIKRAPRNVPGRDDKVGSAFLRAAARRVMARDSKAGARLVRRLKDRNGEQPEATMFEPKSLPLAVIRALATPCGDGLADRNLPYPYLPWSLELERRGEPPTKSYALRHVEASLIDQLNLLSLGLLLGRDSNNSGLGVRKLFEIFLREGVCLHVDGVFLRQALRIEPTRDVDATLAHENPALYLAVHDDQMTDVAIGSCIKAVLGLKLAEEEAEKLKRQRSTMVGRVSILREMRKDPRLAGAWQAEIERSLAVLEPVLGKATSVEGLISRLEKNFEDPANPQPQRDLYILAAIRTLKFQDLKMPGFREAMETIVRLTKRGRDLLDEAAKPLADRMKGRRFGQPRWLVVDVDRFFHQARLFRHQALAELRLAQISRGEERQGRFDELEQSLVSELKTSLPYLREESKENVQNHARHCIRQLQSCRRMSTGSQQEARRVGDSWRRRFELKR